MYARIVPLSYIPKPFPCFWFWFFFLILRQRLSQADPEFVTLLLQTTKQLGPQVCATILGL